MSILIELEAKDREHWELHLKAAISDNPSLAEDIRMYLKGSQLPKLRHPSDFHDWIENPDQRTIIEAKLTDG